MKLQDIVSVLTVEIFPTDNAHPKIFEEWPAEAATWLTENGFAVPVLPEHNPLCTGTIAGNAPIILSPADNTTYYIRTGVSLENQKNSIVCFGFQPNAEFVLVSGR